MTSHAFNAVRFNDIYCVGGYSHQIIKNLDVVKLSDLRSQGSAPSAWAYLTSLTK